MKYPEGWGHTWFWLGSRAERDSEEDFRCFPIHASQFGEPVKMRSGGGVFWKVTGCHHRDGLTISLGKPMRTRMLKLKNAAGALGSSLRDEISWDYRSRTVAEIARFTVFFFVCLFLLSWPSSVCHANLLWGKCGLQFRAFRNKVKACKDH